MNPLPHHVVITGTSGGIGAALAAHFCARGWFVTGIDRLKAPGYLQATAGFKGVIGNITNELDMESKFSAASDRAPISALIANAAVTDLNHHLAVDMPLSVWREVLRINVDGAFLTAQQAARHMCLTGGGNIVFITSSLARLSDAQAGDAPYCSSKAAVEMLCRVLAIELEPLSINVNTLFPTDIIDTGFFKMWSDKDRSRLAPASILNESAFCLATQRTGAVTGCSLDQKLWDNDPHYRKKWEDLS